MSAYQSDLARALRYALMLQEDREIAQPAMMAGAQAMANFIATHQVLVVSAPQLAEACAAVLDFADGNSEGGEYDEPVDFYDDARGTELRLMLERALDASRGLK